MMVLVGTLFSPPGLYRVRVVLVKSASLPPAEAAVELAVLVVVLAEEPAASGQTQSCCADTGDLQKAAARDLFHNSVLLFSWAEAFFVQLLLPNHLIDEKSDVVGL